MNKILKYLRYNKMLITFGLAFYLLSITTGCTKDEGYTQGTSISSEEVEIPDSSTSEEISDSTEILESSPCDETWADDVSKASVISATMTDTVLPYVPDNASIDGAYVELNGNVPLFKDEELNSDSFEFYSDLDELGRCGVTYACLSPSIMPAEGEERGEIGHIKPTGWHTVKYPEQISDLYLYNRCHLIGWQLAGENDNPKNLVTGTRYLNVTGMLPFENQVAEYIRSTGNQVLYRVIPIFDGDNLVMRGLTMEARSIQDDGCVFFVYCPNIQPGISIDYATGESWISGDEPSPAENTSVDSAPNYVLNTSSKKIHRPDCSAVQDMSPKNKEETSKSIDELLEDGYERCKMCNP